MNLISRIEPGWLRTNDALSRPEERERRRRRREEEENRKKDEDCEEQSIVAADALDLVA